MGNLSKQYKFLLLKTDYDQFTHSLFLQGNNWNKVFGTI